MLCLPLSNSDGRDVGGVVARGFPTIQCYDEIEIDTRSRNFQHAATNAFT